MSPSVRSIKKVPGFVWRPPIYSPIYKVEVVTRTGTTYDVTERILEGTYTYGKTDTIGNFAFTIDNSDQIFTGVLNMYDQINIYIDYAETPTTLRFSGLLERVSNRREKIRLTGRSSASRIMGITVTKSFTDQYTHDILQSLLTTYAPFITQTNINTTESSDTQITVNWYQKPFWEAIKELANNATYDAYIDPLFDMHYFPVDSIDNTTEAIVHTNNLIETGDFTPDLSVTKNRIIVYGGVLDNQQIIWTSEDSDTIKTLEEGGFDVREEIINDFNIITTAQAKERADFELALKTNPPVVGEITSLGLPTLAPGERLRISDPLNNLPPQFYAIDKYDQIFSNDEPFQTRVTVKREINTIPKVLKDRIKVEKQTFENVNPNEMRFSYVESFDANSGTNQNTQIVDGFLETNGTSPATWVSDNFTITEDMTFAELRVNGESLPGTEYHISTNDGVFFQTIVPGTVLTLSPIGKKIKLKIVLNSVGTKIGAYSILYKT